MSAELEIDSDDHIVVKKLATDPQDRLALEREAANLERASHPGVVELLSFDDDGEHALLRTEFAGDQTWQSAPPDSVRKLAEAVAAVAMTLADLHNLAVVHNDLRAEHIIVGPVNRPVLCDFRAAGDHDPAIDCAALGHIVKQILETCDDNSPRVRRALGTLALRMTDDNPLARPTLSAVAQSAAAALALGSNQHFALFSRPVGAGLAGLAVLAALAVVVWDSPDPQVLSIPTLEVPATSPSSPSSVADPTTNQETVPSTASTHEPSDPLIIEFDGFRYGVGSASDRAAVSDWNCDGNATAAVLTPYRGEVYIFGGWPQAQAASEIDTVTVSPEVTDIEAPDRCGQIVLVEQDGARSSFDLEQR